MIIGGGIAGLSAAWELQPSAAAGRLTYSLLERGGHWGGKVQTDSFSVRDGGQTVGEFVVDYGPESFITRKRAAWELTCELGLQSEVVSMVSETRNIYVLDGDRPLLAPLSPRAFIQSPLLSTHGKLRMLAEPFMPRRTDDGDESLADFASRRLGREALEKLIGPILGGIYNSNPEEQSILTTSPVMREMERESGSLFVASLMRARKQALLRKAAAQAGETLPPRYVAFRRGAQTLVDALVARLTGNLHLNSTVSALSIAADGYTLTLAGGETITADAVILATPANVAASLLADVAPSAAEMLSKIRHVNIGTISLVYRTAELQIGFPISGLMIPRRAGRAIDAVTFTSERFDNRAPTGYTLIRVFFGGNTPHIMLLDDAQLLAAVRGELAALLGIHAQPLEMRVARWPNSYPQADVGHLELVARIEHALPAGIAVTGSAYRGLGVPDCVAQGRNSARQVLRTWLSG